MIRFDKVVYFLSGKWFGILHGGCAEGMGGSDEDFGRSPGG